MGNARSVFQPYRGRDTYPNRGLPSSARDKTESRRQVPIPPSAVLLAAPGCPLPPRRFPRQPEPQELRVQVQPGRGGASGGRASTPAARSPGSRRPPPPSSAWTSASPPAGAQREGQPEKLLRHDPSAFDRNAHLRLSPVHIQAHGVPHLGADRGHSSTAS